MYVHRRTDIGRPNNYKTNGIHLTNKQLFYAHVLLPNSVTLPLNN